MNKVHFLYWLRWSLLLTLLHSTLGRKQVTYGAIREFTPYVGKDAVLETRLKRAVSAMTKHGANSSIFKVIMGDRAGDYEIYNFYESVAAGAKAMQGFMSDPEMIAVNAERSANPIAEMRGPWVGRMLHNHMRGNVTTVTGVREYQVARRDVPKMMELVPELQKIIFEQFLSFFLSILA